MVGIGVKVAARRWVLCDMSDQVVRKAQPFSRGAPLLMLAGVLRVFWQPT